MPKGRIPSLLLFGDGITDVADVLLDAVIDRTIDGASTLTLEIHDTARTLLRTGIFNSRATVIVDGFHFELVQVRKTGNGLSTTFEDLPVATLRRRDTPLKVSAGTITHVDFAERLVKEAGLKFWTIPGLSPPVSLVELARGAPNASGGGREDSWVALGRMADERGWRRYVRGKDTIAYVPEPFLILEKPVATLQEGVAGVENIDFDFDSGKPVATAKVRVRVGRWDIPVGSAVVIKELGPATGNWLVSGISRSLFSLFLEVSLTRAREMLPEPNPSSTSTTSTSAAVGSIPIIGALLEPATQTPAPEPIAAPPSPPPPVSDPNVFPDDPPNRVRIGQGGHTLVPSAAASFARVEAAVGKQIPITDSYRSTASQAANYAKDPSRFAKPGNSAHGEARAVDVNLGAYGVGNMSSDPKKWDQNSTWKRLNAAFMAEGWCNYQYHAGTTKGRTSEPWHWAYKVCK